jgi:hypothetical protein
MFGFGKKQRGTDSSVPQETEIDEKEPISDAADETDTVETQDDADKNTPAVAHVDKGDESDADDADDEGGVEDDSGYAREEIGPWDVSEIDEDDDIKRIDLGSLKVPVIEGMELRLQVNRERTAITSVMVSKGDSTLEISAFAAPRSLGLWDDIADEIVEGNKNASIVPGLFGDEVQLKVTLGKGKTALSRIVGVDGERWMLRGIFTGTAATQGEDQNAFNTLFSQVVVERGLEPLAPRDLLPLHPPVDTSAQQEEEADDPTLKDISQPDGPLSQDQQTQVQTTLARGPMFSEIR